MFDWFAFFDRYSIEYVTSGHNVRKNNAGVACPWCGDDPSFHLGISLEGKGYHCWRDDTHAGKSPQRLIVALIRCSWAEADAIVGRAVSFETTESTYTDDVHRQLGIAVEESPRKRRWGALEYLPEFCPLGTTERGRQLAYPYLRRRGYTVLDIEELTDRFDLQWAQTGKFAYRIVIPIFMNKKLVNWTGRTVADSETLRYRSLSDDEERAFKDGLPAATMNVKSALWNYDRLRKGGETLVVVEGPFDAMRVEFFGANYGIAATALFSKTATPEQVGLLQDLYERFDHHVLLLDQKAEIDGFRTFPTDYLNFDLKVLPPEVDDPAELTFHQFRKVFGL